MSTTSIHPGIILKKRLKKIGLQQKEVASLMLIPAPNLNEILLGKRSISKVMALRLEKAIGLNAVSLLTLQLKYDLAKARNNKRNQQILKKIKKASQ